MIASVFFLLTVLCVPEILGSGTTPRWALVAVALPLLIPSKKIEFTTAHAFGLLFIWYAAISVSWSHHYDGLDALVKLIVIAEAFVLGSRLDSLKPAIIGMGLGIWVNSLVILSGVGVPLSPSSINPNVGLFANSNIMGETAALVLVAVLVHRLWWLVPGILPAFIMSNCRGAFVALAGSVALMIWRKSRPVSLALLVLGIAAVAYSVSGNVKSMNERLEIWTDVLPHLSIMGTGLGSTFTVFPLYTSMDTLAMRPDHLHNDWLEYAFETGIGSIALFIVLGLSRSIILACLFIEACFGFPTHLAATAVMGGLFAGHAVRNRPGLRYDIATWRISLLASASRLGRKLGHRRVQEGKSGFPA